MCPPRVNSAMAGAPSKRRFHSPRGRCLSFPPRAREVKKTAMRFLRAEREHALHRRRAKGFPFFASFLHVPSHRQRRLLTWRNRQPSRVKDGTRRESLGWHGSCSRFESRTSHFSAGSVFSVHEYDQGFQRVTRPHLSAFGASRGASSRPTNSSAGTSMRRCDPSSSPDSSARSSRPRRI